MVDQTVGRPRANRKWALPFIDSKGVPARPSLRVATGVTWLGLRMEPRERAGRPIGMTTPSATAQFIASATTPKARKRRIEARSKVADLAIGYLRVSSSEQAESGLGLEAQRAEIVACAGRRGVRIIGWYEDKGISGATVGKRPGLLAALAAMGAGEAGSLIAKDITRLSRDKDDLGNLLAAATADGWCVATADGVVDTCDPVKALLPMFLAIVATIERQWASDRMRSAHAAAKARGTRMGPTSKLDPATRSLIVTMRADGTTWREIAERLNADGITTGVGTAWTISTVSAAHRQATA